MMSELSFADQSSEHAPMDDSPEAIENRRLTAVIDDLNRQLQRRTETIQSLTDSVRQRDETILRQRRERAAFNDQVREVAIWAHRAGYWCKEGMNDKLRELGLEEWEPTRTYEGTVTIEARVTVTVDGDSGDTPDELVNFRLTNLSDEVHLDDWEVTDTDLTESDD